MRLPQGIKMDIFPLAFTKMSGTGNDFILIDNRSSQVAREHQADFSRGVCRRMFSAGADGVIFVEDSERADFKWRFYNSDGSVAEMCGNGARCVARFVYENNIVSKSRMCFETLAGIIHAQVFDDGEVQVQLSSPVDYRQKLIVQLDGADHELFFVNTGVPHAILFTTDEDVDVVRWGRDIRFHGQFAPQGTNVNFVRLRADGALHVRTYERGVEDETRACGTGAVASALVAAAQKIITSPVDVITSGGDRLQVAFNVNEEVQGDGLFDNVSLKGPARKIYAGELTAESLL